MLLTLQQSKLIRRTLITMAESSSKSQDKRRKSESESSASESDEASSKMEALSKYFAEKLGFSHGESDSKKPKVLNEVSIDGIAQYIKNKKCKNIITMTGAGISTSAGIPDFRSPGTGLYDNLQKYDLPHPHAIFELDYFKKNPKPFFVLAKELYPGCFKPTVCHYFIRLLSEKGLLLRHYTQNIDTLERVAKIPESKIIEAHGTFYTGHCLECRHLYQLEWMKDKIFADEIPICDKCPGVVKPDIVFFGENLPDNFYSSVQSDFEQCDLLIILGSSLVVQPFASLTDHVKANVPRLLINREKAGQSSGLLALFGAGGLNYDSKNNTRDVAWLGECDEGCKLLAEKMGLLEELLEMCKKEHKQIDEENTKNALKPPKSQKSKSK